MNNLIRLFIGAMLLTTGFFLNSVSAPECTTPYAYDLGLIIVGIGTTWMFFAMKDENRKLRDSS